MDNSWPRFCGSDSLSRHRQQVGHAGAAEVGATPAHGPASGRGFLSLTRVGSRCLFLVRDCLEQRAGHVVWIGKTNADLTEAVDQNKARGSHP